MNNTKIKRADPNAYRRLAFWKLRSFFPFLSQCISYFKELLTRVADGGLAEPGFCCVFFSFSLFSLSEESRPGRAVSFSVWFSSSSLHRGGGYLHFVGTCAQYHRLFECAPVIKKPGWRARRRCIINCQRMTDTVCTCNVHVYVHVHTYKIYFMCIPHTT